MDKQELTNLLNSGMMEHGPTFVIGIVAKFLEGAALALTEEAIPLVEERKPALLPDTRKALTAAQYTHAFLETAKRYSLKLEDSLNRIDPAGAPQ